MDTSNINISTPVCDRAPLVEEHGDPPPNELLTRSSPANNRLSAVPFYGMVRDPKFHIDFPNTEETRNPKRSSSVGDAFRRLFSTSPTPAERSSSEHNVSLLGHETSEYGKSAGQRGRTPPKLTSSANTSGHSVESSTLPPNNRFYCPPRRQDRPNGGEKSQSLSLDRAAMASHRGYDSGQQLGGSRRDQVIEI